MIPRVWWFGFILIGFCAYAVTGLGAQEIDAAAHRSIIEALQFQVKNHPSAFPLESFDGGPQSVTEGLRHVYFGYAERRYVDHLDFHLSMDVAYFPLETGDVKTVDGNLTTVRAPQTYLKKVYAIQNGVLVSVALKSTGYKIILKHTLEKPYFDSAGRAYNEYYTCYRHVDARTLDYLNQLARKALDNEEATYQDLFGKQVFEAGDLIAYVGFDPFTKVVPPRSHLDFSLNLYRDPDKGSNIRKYAVNPLLLFPPFHYGNPLTYKIKQDAIPAYQFVIDPKTIIPPTRGMDGRFRVEIPSGGLSSDGTYTPCRYYALNAMQLTVFNDGKELGSYTLDRHQKLGYETASYEVLDNPDTSKPHFDAPLGEQDDVFLMDAVLPVSWLKKINYDWSKAGSVSVRVSSIWDGYLSGHNHSFEIPLAPE